MSIGTSKYGTGGVGGWGVDYDSGIDFSGVRGEDVRLTLGREERGSHDV